MQKCSGWHIAAIRGGAAILSLTFDCVAKLGYFLRLDRI
jgi:hypothetical protein